LKEIVLCVNNVFIKIKEYMLPVLYFTRVFYYLYSGGFSAPEQLHLIEVYNFYKELKIIINHWN